MNQILAIIENNLLTSSASLKNDQWKIIQDFSIAQKYAYQQYDLETVWLDLRESNSFILNLSTKEDNNFWESRVIPAIEKKLDSLHLDEELKDDLFNDVDSDLFNCYLNNKYKKNHPLWNIIWEAYSHGGWPCGWEGKYPEGQIIIFQITNKN